VVLFHDTFETHQVEDTLHRTPHWDLCATVHPNQRLGGGGVRFVYGAPGVLEESPDYEEAAVKVG
jgi:hypothetical protein